MLKSTQIRKYFIFSAFVTMLLSYSIPVFGQCFGFKPTIAYNFHGVNGIQAHSFGGGMNFENCIEGTKSTLHFSALYFGGKGTLTEEGYAKWFDDGAGPQDPEKVADRNNFDMFYVSAGQRFYLGESEKFMNGAHLGYSLGWGLPTQDNPFGYYWDISAQLGYQYFFKDKRSFDIFVKTGFGQWTYDVEYFKVVYGYGDTYQGLQFNSARMFFIQTGVSVGLFK